MLVSSEMIQSLQGEECRTSRTNRSAANRTFLLEVHACFLPAGRRATRRSQALVKTRRFIARL